MDVAQYGERFEKRTDPWGRAYYWATGEPPPGLGERESDLVALARGLVTLTPLDYNLTRRSVLAEMQPWQFRVETCETEAGDDGGLCRPVVVTARKRQKTNGNGGDSRAARQPAKPE
jgi:hypothetical protein